jgi:hypothetical protein
MEVLHHKSSQTLLASLVVVVLLTAGVSPGVLTDALDTFVPSPSPRTIMSAEEELVYEVSWTVFKLGTIRLRTRNDYTAKAWIDSYDGLPFVDLHSIYYTRMDSLLFSLGAYSVDKGKNGWTGLQYEQDSLVQSRVIVREASLREPNSPPDQLLVRDTINLGNRGFVDGLSIGYFARSGVFTKKTVDVPTVLSGKLGTTTFRFTGKKTRERIEALDDPIRVVEIEGTTNAEGIFGMTGDFKGWFSDDDAAVPIKGKLKVLLGNVTVELIGWKRKGWNPPQ